MTDQRTRETISRLERLEQQGRFDTARAAIARGAPILGELGLDTARAHAILDTSPPQLEAAMGLPISVLEAIVRATNRPPLMVKNDIVQDKASLNGIFAAGIDGKVAAVEHLLPSIGRIEFVNHDMVWGGTGWVIEKEADGRMLIVTNRHVAKLVARRTHRGDGVFMFGPGNARYGAVIDFVEEMDAQPDPSRVSRIESFTYIADDAAADVALARLSVPEPDTDAPAISPLPRATDDGGDGELVAVVGYPAADPFRNDPTEMHRYFKGLYDVKRFAPGFLRVQEGPTVLGHDCTTLGGNSGSPVISLESGKAIGLHFAGQYGVGNSAVRISTINRILDNGAAGNVHGVPANMPTETRDGTHDADHFAGRCGFDEDFLQVMSVPLPVIPDTIPLSAPSDATEARPFELRYQHFSILYSGALKSPVIAALNIDGARTRAIKRTNKRWYKDLRLPADEQLGREDYGDPDIDRGHLVRRAATNWGDTDEIARRANLDSYHYSVASPQHMGLNRNSTTWLGLENHIMNNARTFGFRACVFTGPVFSPDDPPLGDTGAAIPLAYFKVVTMMAESTGEDGILRPNATAYVLSQGQLIQQMLARQGVVETAEGFAFGAFRTFQVRLRDLEDETGYDFGPLREYDPLARHIDRSVTEGAAPVPAFAVDSLESVVL